MGRPRHLKLAREMKAHAERCGLQRVWIDYSRPHPVLNGSVNGSPVRVVFPRTPSDWRSRKNSFADIRRLAREACP
jgi:hypothetical protein